MSKPNHVPKFGNWDAAEQTPFTIVFEKARADHKGGTAVAGMIVNPNDPFQTPSAFGIKSTAAARSSQRPSKPSDINELQKRVDAGRTGPKTSGAPVKSSLADHSKGEFMGGMDESKDMSLGGVHYSEQTPDPPSSLRVHPGNRSAVLAYLGPGKKSVREGSATAHPPSEKRHHRPASRGDDMFTGKGAPLPKFGAWDETDPSAGDGFTLMFGNARKERIIGGPTPLPVHASEISVKEDYEDIYEPPLPSLRQKVARWLYCAGS